MFVTFSCHLVLTKSTTVAENMFVVMATALRLLLSVASAPLTVVPEVVWAWSMSKMRYLFMHCTLVTYSL